MTNHLARPMRPGERTVHPGGPVHPASGFSLLEMLVVIALIALLSLTALPNITSAFRISLNSTARELASTVKEAYNSTVVTGRVHRVVFNLKEGTYWVEAGPANALVDTEQTREKELKKRRMARPDEPPPPSQFSMALEVTRKAMSLPRGVKFEDVISEQSKDPITEGQAYSHIFPSGLAEQTIIHLKDQSDHRNSLVITPLVGRTELYERYVTSNEAFAR